MDKTLQAEEDQAPLGQALLQLAHAADEVRHVNLKPLTVNANAISNIVYRCQEGQRLPALFKNDPSGVS